MSLRTFNTLAAALALVASVSLAAPLRAQDQPAAHSDSVGAAIGDTAITAKVKARLAGDVRVKDSHIEVHTTNGMVTLSGSAANSDASEAAEQLTRGVKGVKDVDNEIEAPSKLSAAAQHAGRKISDDWITTKIKTQLKADRSIQGDSDIEVHTFDGVVTLSGTAASKDALEHAQSVARNVKGVKSVDANNLRLASSQ